MEIELELLEIFGCDEENEPCHENSAELSDENEADGDGEGVVET